MMFEKRAVLFAIALLAGATDAFAPGCHQSVSIVQQKSQLYTPQTALSSDANGANEFDVLAVSDAIEGDDVKGEDYLFNEGELEGDNDDESDGDGVGMEDDGEPPCWYTHSERLTELRATWRRTEIDTGSPEFQAAGMTERISYLTKHLQLHPKDFSTRRGLVALVNKRRRLLNYLHKIDEPKYVDIIKALGIRHRAPSNVQSRVEKYGQFPQQKNTKKHLLEKKKKTAKK